MPGDPLCVGKEIARIRKYMDTQSGRWPDWSVKGLKDWKIRAQGVWRRGMKMGSMSGAITWAIF